jgi:hypothetical protein
MKLPTPESLALPSGRTLSYAILGHTDPATAALTVFYFHGFPASHAEAAVFDSAARARRVRIVAADRPGMGGSAHQPGRRIADWPADVAALAAHPPVAAPPRFAVLGTSGGCPYVLACCAAGSPVRPRLLAAGVVAGLYPPSLGLRGMLLEPRALLWVAPWVPGLVERMLGWSLGAAAAADDEGAKLEALLDESMRKRPGPDKEVWEAGGVFRLSLVASVRGAVGGVDGAKGAAHEAAVLGSPWGFELADVAMDEGKLVLWHGKEDGNAPLLMANKAHALLPGSELRVSDGEAHASLFVHKADEVLGILLERAAR